MDSPYGLAFGLGQVGAGAMNGLVAASQENRARAVQDRSFNLQQAQDAREQGLYGMRQQDWDRQRAIQDAELRASLLRPNVSTNPITSSIPDVNIPDGHPDSQVKHAIGTAEIPSGAIAPASMPSVGLIPSAPSKGSAAVDTAIRTGKANTLANPDSLLASANASLAQANAYNQQIHDEFAKSGMDQNTTQGQIYMQALEKHLGAYRDASYNQALQLRQQADQAKVMTYGQRASNFLLKGDVEKAAPYLHAMGADPSLFEGMTKKGDFYVLQGGSRFTADALEAMANPNVSQDERMKAMAHVTDAVIKEQEALSHVRAAYASAGKEPTWNSEKRIAELTRIPNRSAADNAELEQLTNMRRDNGLVSDKQTQSKIAGYQRTVVQLQAQLIKAKDAESRAQIQGQIASGVKMLNELGDFSLGAATVVPETTIHHWYKPNEKVPEHFGVTAISPTQHGASGGWEPTQVGLTPQPPSKPTTPVPNPKAAALY